MFVLSPIEALLIFISAATALAFYRGGKMRIDGVAAVVASIGLASLITPPDPGSTLLLGGTILGSYLLGRRGSIRPGDDRKQLAPSVDLGSERIELSESEKRI